MDTITDFVKILELKPYSKSTIDNYRSHLNMLKLHFKNKNLNNITDIDSERMVVHVKDAKGKKDRYTILSKKTLDILRNYYIKFKPKEYLFEGQKGGKYSSESAGQIFKKALKNVKINKPATLHTLRHSFATHLLEDGIGIVHIQRLLGHSNIKTTLIYTQIAQDFLLNIKSPFDD